MAYRIMLVGWSAGVLDIVHPKTEGLILSGDQFPKEAENWFYNLPGCSGPVQSFSAIFRGGDAPSSDASSVETRRGS
jgi:hypothetical protein